MKRHLLKKILLLLVCGINCNWTWGTIDGNDRILWSGRPAASWEHAFVTGNGRHGTMVLGNVDEERIICVHEELFIRAWDRNKSIVPVTSQYLPEVRRLIDTGKAGAAGRMVAKEADRQLKEAGCPLRWPLIPHPAFDLCIRRNGGKSGKETYRRQLNLETGEASVGWSDQNGKIEESVFSSRKHDVNVIYLRGSEGRKLDVTLSLEETPGRKGIHFEHDLDNAFATVENDALDGGWLTYRASYAKDSGGYEGLARVTTKGGSLKKGKKTLVIKDADEILIVIRISPLNCSKSSKFEPTKRELLKLSHNYQTLLAAHSERHKKLFNRMRFNLESGESWSEISTEQMLATIQKQGMTPLALEQLFAMGRYLLISSCGSYPPPLQGIWGGGWKPNWIGGFVWDSNINLAISATTMANLPECAQTYNNFVKHLLPGWRKNAQNYLGCRGFIVAHYNDPLNGYLTHFGNYYPWMLWPGGAGWNIRPLYEYAMLMGDDKFLKESVLPLYIEMGEFYEDFLVMGDDGYYHIYPSMSPENSSPGNGSMVCKDATMDVAIAKEVFSILCQLGKKFHLKQENIDKWATYLGKLPAYRINEDGVLAEWADPRYADSYNHRHASHLYPIFPGTELMNENIDASLKQATCVALNKRFEFDTSSAHGLIHVALQAARLKDVEKVNLNLQRFSQRQYLYDGLSTSHEPKNAIYNLDAILSFPRLLMEMLVYTDSGYIELLPAWPMNYPDGTIKGMRIYGGHTLDLRWESGKVREVTIHAQKTEEYKLSYQGQSKSISLKKGKSETFYFEN